VYEIKYYKHSDGSKVLDRTWRVVTDSKGRAHLSNEYLDGSFASSEFYLNSAGKPCLPLGTVTIQEVKAPEGYLLNNKIYTDEINEESETVETVKTFNAPAIGTNDEVAEQVKRGDIQLVKVKDGTMTRLPNISFKITSKTTGESHIICTDENGMIDSSASFNSHKNDTNGGTAESGLWFGEIDAIDDEKGALIYDYYTISELRSDGNKGLKLAEDIEFRVYRDNAVINLGTITDDVIEIGTTAVDSDTKNHISLADNKVTIIDTVKYKNFFPGKAYKLCGTLMDKETGEPIKVNGKNVTSEKEFTPNTENGTVDIEFTFDATALAGTDVVVFEKVFDVATKTEICSHEDINDEGQTISIPKIGTKATDGDEKTNVIKAEKEQKIVDTVAYENLLPGMEYELTTWLTKDGKKIWGTEVSKKFTPNTADGEVKATLSFDATKYGGENITVFEEISLKHKLVAEHKDKDDKDQTLTVEKALENPNTPKTGDNNHMMIWLALAVIAAVLGSGLMVCELKKKKGNTKSK
ncbi:MAG: VaFE repeat-containing surface-anchored protein, partial [Firmicutes bacterium]|nr:VaFE repeat-containing surface-anchored protein [Bacillota bacterium]